MQKNEIMLHTQKKKSQQKMSSESPNFESSRQRLKLAITNMFKLQICSSH